MSIESKLDTLNGYIEYFADDVADGADGLQKLSEEIKAKTLPEPVCITSKMPNINVILYVLSSNVHAKNVYNIEYSYDLINWTSVEVSNPQNDENAVLLPLANYGDKVYLRGDNDTLSSKVNLGSAGLQIAVIGTSTTAPNASPKANVSGNLMSLMYGTSYNIEKCRIPSFGFKSVFKWAWYPFTGDFDGAYIDVDTIGFGALQMTFGDFIGKSLPVIRANHIEPNGCVQMFEGYSNGAILTKYDLQLVNDLQNCPSLFSYQKSLTDLTVHFAEFPSGGIANWMSGVAPTGVFRCPTALEIPTRSTSYVPEGWTIERID